MSNHLENELPSSRINITLDLATAGATDSKVSPNGNASSNSHGGL